MNLELKFRYEEDAVIAAQRARFRKSRQVRFLFPVFTVILGAIPLVVSSIPGTAPSKDHPGIQAMELAAIPIGVVLLVYAFASRLDFRLNGFWRTLFHLRIQTEGLSLRADSAEKWLPLPWASVSRWIEIPQAFIFLYTSERDFFILPKSPLDEAGREGVRQLLANTRKIN